MKNRMTALSLWVLLTCSLCFLLGCRRPLEEMVIGKWLGEGGGLRESSIITIRPDGSFSEIVDSYPRQTNAGTWYVSGKAIVFTVTKNEGAYSEQIINAAKDSFQTGSKKWERTYTRMR